MGARTSTSVELVVASQPEDYLAARTLFSEYASQLGVDLCFQNFSDELERLPEMYGHPGGRLILAQSKGHYIGCVGVRTLANTSGTCEMKRLYVCAEARGLGLGRQLAVASIDAARQLGYKRMVLDTLGSMTAARALYWELGFRETPPYYLNPGADVAYLELVL
jgi:ribosomal protein S18 acetylase RimI-like enzyme